MEAFAAYLFKSAVWLTGFTLVYLLFLRNERYFLLNRIYLLTGIVASIIFPLVTWHYTVMIPVTPTIEVSDLQMTGVISEPEPFPTQMILLGLYLAGVLYLLYRLTRQTLGVINMIRKSEILPYRSAKLIRTADYPASFSFFSYVFVNPSNSETETNEIVNHELEHVRQQHWIDLVLFELLCILQWMNPLCWLYGRFIRQNHEYLADEQALQRSANPAIYRAALLNQLFGGQVITLANSFNYSINKKRFNMMKNTINSPIRKLKLLLVMPLMAVVFYAFAAPEYKYAYVENAQSTPKPLYYVGNDKIDIGFSTNYEKEDLESLKADLNQLGIIIDYKSLDFTSEGKLKQISASIKYPDGTSGSIVSWELTSTDSPGFRRNFDVSSDDIKKTITGKVVIEDGPPLSGANVVIYGKTIGTITDDYGNFKLQVTDDSPILISYVGLQTQKVTPEFDKEMVITLKPGKIGIDELVVVGYGTAKKETDNSPQSNSTFQLRNSNGTNASPLYVIDGVISELQNINSINPETIESVSIITDASAISKYGDKGKNGVVEIILKKGASTTNTEKVVTGQPLKLSNSNGATAKPLIVIDGVIAENQDMSNIDPDHIESINVIKDASATGKYGDNGKNGVIEIILKKEQPNSSNQGKNTVFTQVEEMPEYPGGLGALRKYLAMNVKYPAEAQRNGIQGKVFVSFVVTRTGLVSNVKITRGVAPSLDREALRIVQSMPAWKPGKQNGKTVDVEYTLPIIFNLQQDTGKSEAKKDSENPVFLMVEQMPEFPGGNDAFRNFIATHVKYPVEAQQKGIQGKVYVTFVVTKTGKVTNAQIARGVDPSLDKEAIRVVELLPTWTPGKQGGKEVDVQYTAPINFALEGNTQPQANPSVEKGKLIIVPNPTNKQVKVTLEGSDASSELQVSLFDNYGKLVRKETKKGPSFSLSVNSLTPGTYLVVATDGSKQYQGNLVVNR